MFNCFFPDEYLDSTYVIDFDRLYEQGYRGLLFDIDNTLVPHGAPADARACALFSHLKELGFKCLDSQANFIFVTHPEYDAKEMFEALKKEDIYVRFWGSERIEQYMRVTVGTREEMEALFAFLRRYIKGE